MSGRFDVVHVLDPQHVVKTFFLPYHIPAKAVEIGVLMYTGHLMSYQAEKGSVHIFRGDVSTVNGIKGGAVCNPMDIAATLQIEDRDVVFTCLIIPYTWRSDELQQFWIRMLLRDGLAEVWGALHSLAFKQKCYFGNAVAYCVWSGFAKLPLAKSEGHIINVEEEIDFLNFLIVSEWTTPSLRDLFEFALQAVTFFQDPLTMYRKERNTVDVSWGNNQVFLEHAAKHVSLNEESSSALHEPAAKKRRR